MNIQTAGVLFVIICLGIILIGPQLPRILDQTNINETIIVDDTSKSDFIPEDGVIDIGFICASKVGLETSEPLFKQIIEPDINEYVASLGYNFTFNFVIETADAQAQVHFEKVQLFNRNGIDIFLGGGWSSQAQASLDYVVENDMLMVSSSSTSPILAIPGDRFYRTCVTDFQTARVLVDMVDSWGVDGVIVMQINNTWGRGMFDVMEGQFDDRGIDLIDRIVYHPEVSEFSGHLQLAETSISENAEEYGYERIAFVPISFDEIVLMVRQLDDYPELTKVIWMTPADLSTCRFSISHFHGEVPDYIDDIGLFQTSLVWNDEFDAVNLSGRFKDLVAQPASYYTGTMYDAAWLIALSILEAESVNGSEVAAVLPDVAGEYVGVTGSLALDEYGDRKYGYYQFFGNGMTDGDRVMVLFGYSDEASGQFVWFDDVLEEQGYKRPG